MQATFRALGVELSCPDDQERNIIVRNTPQRAQELIEDLRTCQEQKEITAKQWRKLQGRLHFASSQLAGRMPRHLMRKVTQGLADSKGNKEHVFLSLGRLAAFLEETNPRILTPLSYGTVYVFTDASQEGRWGLAMGLGLGCACYNEAGQLLAWFGIEIPAEQAEIMIQGKQKVINELESLAVAVSFSLLRRRIHGKRVMFYLDSEAARITLLRMKSDSHALELLAGICGMLELEMQCLPWYGRVFSRSNPADDPSRMIFNQLSAITSA